MSRSYSLIAIALSACGSPQASPAAKPEPTPVAVPDAPDQEEPGVTEEPLGAQERPIGALADCAAALRASPGVGGSSEEADSYARALAHEQHNDWVSARKAHYEIVSRTPSSPYVPLVYLAFGEMFARDAASDPTKWDLARQSYLETLKYPPPTNPAWTYAALRIAEADRAKGDAAQALSHYMKVLDSLQSKPDQRCAAELATEARRGAVLAFADTGAPNRAYALFQRYGGAQADAWLAELVDEYLKRGKRADACAAIGSAPASAPLARSRTSCP